jgi:CheY-like chemotaxis protein
MFDSATSTVRILTHDQKVRRARGTILIVEDHPDSREMLSLLFSSLGYTVLEAYDGHEALRIVQDTDLDLIITDLGLPEMDGLELVRRVRAGTNDSGALKIVLLTAYDRKDCLLPALQAGCDLVVGKPIDLDKFERLVNLLPQDSQSQFCISHSNAPRNQSRRL